MGLFYRNSSQIIFNGDCRSMVELPDNLVHCVVTSPPYWGLRKYAGVGDSVWNGEKDCQHEWGESIIKKTAHHASETNPGLEGYTKNAGAWGSQQGQFCLKCGAWRGQLGNEPTPELYIKHLIQIFREVKRVLRPDGVCWVNIGESMSGGGRKTSVPQTIARGNKQDLPLDYSPARDMLDHPTIKPLDKCLIPFRLAIALQADGWYLRQDIIWEKPNPMPESVRSPAWIRHKVGIKIGKAQTGETRAGRPLESAHHPYRGDGWEVQSIEGRQDSEYIDCPGCPKCLPNDGLVLRGGSWRPTEAHEYILMLTKTGKYCTDQEAVRENSMAKAIPVKSERRGLKTKGQQEVENREQHHGQDIDTNPLGRNMRSVWKFPTQSYGGDHYATFPEKLPEICIKAGTPECGVCAECGKPWARILKVEHHPSGRTRNWEDVSGLSKEQWGTGNPIQDTSPGAPSVTTLGWRPMCQCQTDKPAIPALVLDPFAGTGTTLVVARRLGRRAIGYELSEEYCKLAVERIGKGLSNGNSR